MTQDFISKQLMKVRKTIILKDVVLGYQYLLNASQYKEGSKKYGALILLKKESDQLKHLENEIELLKNEAKECMRRLKNNNKLNPDINTNLIDGDEKGSEYNSGNMVINVKSVRKPVLFDPYGQHIYPIEKIIENGSEEEIKTYVEYRNERNEIKNLDIYLNYGNVLKSIQFEAYVYMVGSNIGITYNLIGLVFSNKNLRSRIDFKSFEVEADPEPDPSESDEYRKQIEEDADAYEEPSYENPNDYLEESEVPF